MNPKTYILLALTLATISCASEQRQLISSNVRPAPTSGHDRNVTWAGARGPKIHDPLEDDPYLKKVFAEADAKAERKLARVPRTIGFCHLFWATKKKILREDYGIDWKTPDELNPSVSYD